ERKRNTLNWSKPAGAQSYDYTLKTPAGGTASGGTTTKNTMDFTATSDGVWSFGLTTHIGSQTASSSFTIRIDSTAPNPFTVSVAQTSDKDPFPVLTYPASDATSGIDHYEIVVGTAIPISTTETSYKLVYQNPGEHDFTVRAFDKAGNVTEAKGQFTVVGFAGPTLTDVTRVVGIYEPVTVTGTAYYGATARLMIDGNQVAEFAVKENMTDAQRKSMAAAADDNLVVEWQYTVKVLLAPGRHMVTAIQIKSDGSISNPSNGLYFNVIGTMITIGKYSVSLIILIPVLFLLLLLLILLFAYLWMRTRKRLASRGGTATNASNASLKAKIDAELAHLEKTVAEDLNSTKPPTEVSKKINQDISQSKEKLDKTV
ncbi:MAG TPA: hypothetical protein VMQ44_03030, partial [Candidatus Saccharimonadales bacterium]|nr:hypothetical protein [Candidatus Saccharimonadales bacterium]